MDYWKHGLDIYAENGARSYIVFGMAFFSAIVVGATYANLFAQRSQDVRLAFIHNPTASSGEGLVLDDDNSFSTLLYHQLVRGSADFDSIEALITKALLHRQLVRETPDNDDGPEQIKIFAPGSPIVEQAAKHDAKAWEEQLRVLERAGLASDFTGIILNGRVRTSASKPFLTGYVY